MNFLVTQEHHKWSHCYLCFPADCFGPKVFYCLKLLMMSTIYHFIINICLNFLLANIRSSITNPVSHHMNYVIDHIFTIWCTVQENEYPVPSCWCIPHGQYKYEANRVDGLERELYFCSLILGYTGGLYHRDQSTIWLPTNQMLFTQATTAMIFRFLIEIVLNSMKIIQNLDMF